MSNAQKVIGKHYEYLLEKKRHGTELTLFTREKLSDGGTYLLEHDHITIGRADCKAIAKALNQLSKPKKGV